MFFCGCSFVGGELAGAVTPTGMDGITYVELKNGIYDDLYITRATNFTLSNQCPKQWDFDTVLWAKFNGTTNAGNVDWSLETVSHMLLKSRSEGKFTWKTLLVKEIHALEDFAINYPDYFVGSGETIEYAIVPALYGCEGNYATTKITPRFEKMFLMEDQIVWGTEISDMFCDTTRNLPSSNVELLNSRYPIFVRNSVANYDTGNCMGSFVPIVEEASCELAYDSVYDYQRITYQKHFMDFLCDGVPKILKLPDGRKWLIQVTPNPTDTANASYQNREISFSWVEVGGMDSEKDLYYLGLSTVSEEWWNT